MRFRPLQILPQAQLRTMKATRTTVPRPAWFILIFFSLFGFIGLTLLIFLWFGSMDAMGDPPLIFKLVGSFISLGFMAMGFGMPVTAILAWARGEIPKDDEDEIESDGGSAKAASGYRCPHCAAGLGEAAEVSPSGDVKCSYCNKWMEHPSRGRLTN
jgi:hypothetical protein